MANQNTQYSDEYLKILKELIRTRPINLDETNWVELLPIIMELVDKDDSLSSIDKERVVYDLGYQILVEDQKMVSPEVYSISTMLINNLIIPASKGAFDINKPVKMISKWKCCGN